MNKAPSPMNLIYSKNPMYKVPRVPDVVQSTVGRLIDTKLNPVPVDRIWSITDPLLNLKIRDSYKYYDRNIATELLGRYSGATIGASIGAGLTYAAAAILTTMSLILPDAGALAVAGAAVALDAPIVSAVGAGAGALTSDYTTYYATKDLINDTLIKSFKKGFGEGALTTLQTVGKSMDIIEGGEAIRSVIYSTINGENVLENVLKSYGLHEEGRTDYDFSKIRESLDLDLGYVGNIVFDMTGELITDPGVVSSFGKSVLGKQGGGRIFKKSGKATKVYRETTRSFKVFKEAVEKEGDDFINKISRTVMDGDQDEFVNLISGKTKIGYKTITNKATDVIGPDGLPKVIKEEVFDEDLFKKVSSRFYNNIRKKAFKNTTVKVYNTFKNVDNFDDWLTGKLFKLTNGPIALASLVNKQVPELLNFLGRNSIKMSKFADFVLGNSRKNTLLSATLDKIVTGSRKQNLEYAEEFAKKYNDVFDDNDKKILLSKNIKSEYDIVKLLSDFPYDNELKAIKDKLHKHINDKLAEVVENINKNPGKDKLVELFKDFENYTGLNDLLNFNSTQIKLLYSFKVLRDLFDLTKNSKNLTRSQLKAIQNTLNSIVDLVKQDPANVSDFLDSYNLKGFYEFLRKNLNNESKNIITDMFKDSETKYKNFVNSKIEEVLTTVDKEIEDYKVLGNIYSKLIDPDFKIVFPDNIVKLDIDKDIAKLNTELHKELTNLNKDFIKLEYIIKSFPELNDVFKEIASGIFTIKSSNAKIYRIMKSFKEMFYNKYDGTGFTLSVDDLLSSGEIIKGSKLDDILASNKDIVLKILDSSSFYSKELKDYVNNLVPTKTTKQLTIKSIDFFRYFLHDIKDINSLNTRYNQFRNNILKFDSSITEITNTMRYTMDSDMIKKANDIINYQIKQGIISLKEGKKLIEFNNNFKEFMGSYFKNELPDIKNDVKNKILKSIDIDSNIDEKELLNKLNEKVYMSNKKIKKLESNIDELESKYIKDSKSTNDEYINLNNARSNNSKEIAKLELQLEKIDEIRLKISKRSKNSDVVKSNLELFHKKYDKVIDSLNEQISKYKELNKQIDVKTYLIDNEIYKSLSQNKELIKLRHNLREEEFYLKNINTVINSITKPKDVTNKVNYYLKDIDTIKEFSEKLYAFEQEQLILALRSATNPRSIDNVGSMFQKKVNELNSKIKDLKSKRQTKKVVKEITALENQIMDIEKLVNDELQQLIGTKDYEGLFNKVIDSGNYNLDYDEVYAGILKDTTDDIADMCNKLDDILKENIDKYQKIAKLNELFPLKRLENISSRIRYFNELNFGNKLLSEYSRLLYNFISNITTRWNNNTVDIKVFNKEFDDVYSNLKILLNSYEGIKTSELYGFTIDQNFIGIDYLKGKTTIRYMDTSYDNFYNNIMTKIVQGKYKNLGDTIRKMFNNKDFLFSKIPLNSNGDIIRNMIITPELSSKIKTLINKFKFSDPMLDPNVSAFVHKSNRYNTNINHFNRNIKDTIFIYLDTETTGPTNNGLLSASYKVLKYNKDSGEFEVIAKKNMYLNKEEFEKTGWIIDETVDTTNGGKGQTLANLFGQTKDNTYSPSSIIKEIDDIGKAYDNPVFVAHNANFDYDILKLETNNINNLDLDYDFLDTLSLYRTLNLTDIFDNVTSFKNVDVAKQNKNFNYIKVSKDAIEEQHIDPSKRYTIVEEYDSNGIVNYRLYKGTNTNVDYIIENSEALHDADIDTEVSTVIFNDVLKSMLEGSNKRGKFNTLNDLDKSQSYFEQELIDEFNSKKRLTNKKYHRNPEYDKIINNENKSIREELNNYLNSINYKGSKNRLINSILESNNFKGYLVGSKWVNVNLSKSKINIMKDIINNIKSKRPLEMPEEFIQDSQREISESDIVKAHIRIILNKVLFENLEEQGGLDFLIQGLQELQGIDFNKIENIKLLNKVLDDANYVIKKAKESESNLPIIEDIEEFASDVNTFMDNFSAKRRFFYEMIMGRNLVYKQWNRNFVNLDIINEYTSNSSLLILKSLLQGDVNYLIKSGNDGLAPLAKVFQNKEIRDNPVMQKLYNLFDDLDNSVAFYTNTLDEIDPEMLDSFHQMINIVEKLKDNEDMTISLTQFALSYSKRYNIDFNKLINLRDRIIQQAQEVKGGRLLLQPSGKFTNELYQVLSDTLLQTLKSIDNQGTTASKYIVSDKTLLTDDVEKLLRNSINGLREKLSGYKSANRLYSADPIPFYNIRNGIKIDGFENPLRPDELVKYNSTHTLKYGSKTDQNFKVKESLKTKRYQNKILNNHKLYKPYDPKDNKPFIALQEETILGRLFNRIADIIGMSHGRFLENASNYNVKYSSMYRFIYENMLKGLIDLPEGIDTKSVNEFNKALEELQPLEYITDMDELKDMYRAMFVENIFFKYNYNDISKSALKESVFKQMPYDKHGLVESSRHFLEFKKFYINNDGTYNIKSFRDYLLKHKEYSLTYWDGYKLKQLNPNSPDDTLALILADETGAYNLISRDMFLKISKDTDSNKFINDKAVIKFYEMVDGKPQLVAKMKNDPDSLEIENLKKEFNSENKFYNITPTAAGSFINALRTFVLIPSKILSLTMSFPFLVQNAVTAFIQNKRVTGDGIIETAINFFKTGKQLMHYDNVFSHIVYNDTFIEYTKTQGIDWITALERRDLIKDLKTINPNIDLNYIKYIEDLKKEFIDFDSLKEIDHILSSNAAMGEISELQHNLEIEKINKSKLESLKNSNPDEFYIKNPKPNDGFNSLKEEYNYLMAKAKRSSKEWRRTKELKNMINVNATRKYYNFITKNKVSKKFLDVNEFLEKVARISEIKSLESKGFTEAYALSRTIDTHFLYNNKSVLEQYLEFLVPFISYPIRAANQMNELINDYDFVNMMYLIDKFNWQDENSERSDYLTKRRAKGDIPIGNKLLQIGNPLMDTMYNINNPLEAFNNKLSPFIKPFVDLATDAKYNRITQFPVVSQTVNFYNIIKERNLLESFTNDYYKQSGYINYYLPRRNIYNKFYNSLYTKTGYSRVALNMQKTNNNNLKYRVNQTLYY